MQNSIISNIKIFERTLRNMHIVFIFYNAIAFFFLTLHETFQFVLMRDTVNNRQTFQLDFILSSRRRAEIRFFSTLRVNFMRTLCDGN